LEDFVGAEFYCLHALADGSACNSSILEVTDLTVHLVQVIKII